MTRMIPVLLATLFCAVSLCYATDETQPEYTPPNQEMDRPAPESTQVETSAQPATTTIDGTISKVDVANKKITVKTDLEETRDYTFNDKSSFMRQNAPIRAEDLKKNDRVSLEVDANNVIVKLQHEKETSDEGK